MKIIAKIFLVQNLGIQCTYLPFFIFADRIYPSSFTLYPGDIWLNVTEPFYVFP